MARAKKITSIEHIDALAKKLRIRLKRTMTALDKLEKQKARLLKAAKAPTVKVVTFEPMFEGAVPVSVPAYPTVDSETTLGTVPPKPEPLAVAHPLDTAIPSFLRRTPDPVAEQIKSQQAETKQLKARGRIAKMKAKQAGDLKKMPLTGKAALAAIRG
jgi:hypothetical protein